MARVFKARHQQTGEIVALKVATEIALLDQTLRKRFHREFAVARALCHPHLVRALDCGEVDDALYQALEFIEGQNLGQRIRDKGLAVDEAVAVFTQVAGALQYVHEQGVLHRDIKPSNIMLHESGLAKLADFGLLKNLASQSSVLTRSNQSMGTIAYGAPEQFEDAKRADARCDLYSLAATFYTAVAGQFPFGSGGNIKILRRKLQNQFVPLRQMAPAIVAPLDQLITRCLHPSPQCRPQSCAEFIAALDEQRARGATAISTPAARGPGVTAADKNRRQAFRSPVQLAATCEPMFAQGRKFWTAAITNLSKTGLCLHTASTFDVNTVLQVNLQVPGAAEAASKLVRVRWVKPSVKEQCAVGCEFVRPLPSAEFDALHLAGTPKTAIVHAARQ
jgi:serine/threonine-protein kinase